MTLATLNPFSAVVLCATAPMSWENNFMRWSPSTSGKCTLWKANVRTLQIGINVAATSENSNSTSIFILMDTWKLINNIKELDKFGKEKFDIHLWHDMKVLVKWKWMKYQKATQGAKRPIPYLAQFLYPPLSRLMLQSVTSTGTWGMPLVAHWCLVWSGGGGYQFSTNIAPADLQILDSITFRANPPGAIWDSRPFINMQ